MLIYIFIGIIERKNIFSIKKKNHKSGQILDTTLLSSKLCRAQRTNKQMRQNSWFWFTRRKTSSLSWRFYYLSAAFFRSIVAAAPFSHTLFILKNKSQWVASSRGLANLCRSFQPNRQGNVGRVTSAFSQATTSNLSYHSSTAGGTEAWVNALDGSRLFLIA